MMNIDFKSIERAVEVINMGISKRCDLDNGVKVYSVGDNVIRIDIKKGDK